MNIKVRPPPAPVPPPLYVRIQPPPPRQQAPIVIREAPPPRPKHIPSNYLDFLFIKNIHLLSYLANIIN